MPLLIAGLVLFLGVHSVQVFWPNLRQRIIALWGGVGGWAWPYAAIAGLGLILIVFGYGSARGEAPVIYEPPSGLRHLAVLVMLPVFPLLLATYIKGRIRQLVGHPMLIATMLWASAHIMANGSLADLALFGSVLLWAIMDWRSLLRREGSTASAPHSKWGRNDAIAVLGGLILYAAFLGGLHALVFGVSPL